jgi:hypothetical protein
LALCGQNLVVFLGKGQADHLTVVLHFEPTRSLFVLRLHLASGCQQCPKQRVVEAQDPVDVSQRSSDAQAAIGVRRVAPPIGSSRQQEP